jgi:hypothetical protein
MWYKFLDSGERGVVRTRSVKLGCYTPIQTTKSPLHFIAEGLAAEALEEIDSTLPKDRARQLPPFLEKLVLLGVRAVVDRLVNTCV